MPSFYVLSTPPSFTDNKQYSSLCAFMCTSLSPRIYLQISTSISLRILLSCCHRTSSRVSLGIPVEWFFAFFFGESQEISAGFLPKNFHISFAGFIPEFLHELFLGILQKFLPGFLLEFLRVFCRSFSQNFSQRFSLCCFRGPSSLQELMSGYFF